MRKSEAMFVIVGGDLRRVHVMRSFHARTGRSRRHAYTLLELLIVVGLLGLAGSLLIPYMVGRSSLETQSAVRRVIADISFAQADAISHQEYRRVYFYEDGRGYCIIRVGANFDAEFDPDTADYIYDPLGNAGPDGKYIVDFTADKRYEHVSIQQATLDNNQRYLTFDQTGGTVMSGGAPGTGGHIIVHSDDASYRIDVEPFTGRLTVVKLSQD